MMPQQLQMSRSRHWTLCSSTCECEALSGDDSGKIGQTKQKRVASACHKWFLLGFEAGSVPSKVIVESIWHDAMQLLLKQVLPQGIT